MSWRPFRVYKFTLATGTARPSSGAGHTQTVMRTLVILVTLAAVGAFLVWGLLAEYAEPGGTCLSGCGPRHCDPCTTLGTPPLSGS
jgi:hypothetical protein